MVTRPNTSDLVPAPLSQAANNPPYPTSPVADRKSDGPLEEDGEDTGSDWDKDSDDEQTAPRKSGQINPEHVPLQTAPQIAQVELPEALKIGSQSNPSQSSSRTSLPGVPSEEDNTSKQAASNNAGSLGRKFSNNNPYFRMQQTGSTNFNTEDNPWGTPPPPSQPPPPPPIHVDPATPAAEGIADLSISEIEAGVQKPLVDGFPEMRETPVEQPPLIPVTTAQETHTGFSPIAQSNPWVSEPTAEEKWSDVPPPSDQPEAHNVSDQRPEDEKELAPELPPRTVSDTEQPPPKPPRPEVNVAQPSSNSRPDVETPVTKANRQRSEHYSIKHINWYDERSRKNPRRSPILIQNANGPCPLLALVNALVLSTPPGLETILVETLRVREQVSLGLLLDAVFEELMSGRRGGAAQELPDVGDLYAFLVTLHTGMNVNPAFVTTHGDETDTKDEVASPGAFEETREMRLYGTFAVPLLHGWLPPVDSTALPALRRSARTYEDAQNLQFREEELEEKLRVSSLTPEEQQIFEDVINIKEFLQMWPTQLTEYGLRVLNDSIKPGHIAILFRNDHFSTLYKDPRSKRLMTLVTDAGFSGHDEIVWESLADVSGRSSAFFSGDFRPVGNVQEQASAAGHTKSPQRQHQPAGSLLDDDGAGWETVPSRRGKSMASPSSSVHDTGIASAQETGVTNASSSSNQPNLAASPTIEQEDHDLALALQLQEEEEDAHRRSQAARRREDDLSRRYVSRETRNLPIPGQDVRPEVPPRRSGRGGNVNVTTTHRPQPSGEDAPPSYEQAASDRPYLPGQNQASDANSPTTGRRRQSAYGQQSGFNSMGQNANPLAPGQAAGGRGAGGPNSPARRRGPRTQSLGDQNPPAMGGMGRGGRRVSGQQMPAVGAEDREKCIIM
ncbi:MAG: hypothetical protein M1820_005411 [Bogoriella megaspora]|nr:MAG: hypothetical protein M1820_005411 [Bogoriella megaspora]